MKNLKMFFAAIGIASLVAFLGAAASLAQDPAPTANVIHVGSTIYDLLIAYATVIGTIVSAVIVWVQMKVREKTGVDIDFGHRDAIETFVKNQAGNFLNKFDSLKGIDVTVKNPLIAQLANAAMERIPDALDHFGLGPADIAQRISDMIGRLTAPATVAVPLAAPPSSALKV